METGPSSAARETAPGDADAPDALSTGGQFSSDERAADSQFDESSEKSRALLVSGANLLRGLASNRAALLTAVGVVAAGLALGWEWLAAAGALPLLLSALPCVAMCALGLCMRGRNGQSYSGQPQQHRDTAPAGKTEVTSETAKEIDKWHA